MKLSKANRHLRNPIKGKDALWISAKSSSAVEGIRKPFESSNSGRVGSESELVDYWRKVRRTKSAK